MTTYKIKSVDDKEYKVSQDGTYYHKDTPDKVIEILERCRKNHTRVQVFYGDTKTGRDWHEEHDTMGYIGRSTGPISIPILVYNSRSYGGGALLDHCIVRIRTTLGKVDLYRADNYQQPEIEIVESDMEEYSHNTIIDGKLYGRHRSKKSAERLKAKLS